MSLDLGTLYGQIVYDPDPALRAFRLVPDAAEQAMRDTARQLGRLPAAAQQTVNDVDAEFDRMAREAEAAGEETGGKLKSGLKAGVAGLALVGAAAGATFMSGLSDAMADEARTDFLGAALGTNERQTRRYGEIAARVYRDAFGETLDETAGAVRAVASTVEDFGGGRGLERLSAQAITFAELMDTDVAQAVMVAQQMVTEGLVPDVERGFDALLSGGRKLPAFLQGDLLDIVSEYAPYLADLGLSVDQMFTILGKGAEQGNVGFDKAGDFLKEFGLVATNVEDSGDAYKAIGLDADDMANRILKGGGSARGALQLIARELLAIEDPATRANTAVALFGTPLEDLGKSNIPAILRALADGEDGLGRFEGAMQRAVDSTGDNATSRFTSFKRGLQGDIVDYIDTEVLPTVDDLAGELNSIDLSQAGEKLGALWDDAQPGLESFGGWLIDDFLPSVVEATESAIDGWQGMVDAIQDGAEENPELFELMKDAGAFLIESIFPAIGSFTKEVLPLLGEGIVFGVETAGRLAIAFTYVGQYGAEAAGMILDTFGWAFEQILVFMDNALSVLPDWIPGIGGIKDAVSDARDGFSDFRSVASDELDGFAGKMETTRSILEGMLTADLKIDTSDAEDTLNTFFIGPVVPERVFGPKIPVPTGHPTAGESDGDADGDRPSGGRPRGGDYDDRPSSRGIYIHSLQPQSYYDFIRQMNEANYATQGDGVNRGPRR